MTIDDGPTSPASISRRPDAFVVAEKPTPAPPPKTVVDETTEERAGAPSSPVMGMMASGVLLVVAAFGGSAMGGQGDLLTIWIAGLTIAGLGFGMVFGVTLASILDSKRARFAWFMAFLVFGWAGGFLSA